LFLPSSNDQLNAVSWLNW